jgi:hypothetical protein
MRRHDDQVDSFFFGTVDDGAEGLAGIDHLAHFQPNARIGDFLGDEFLKPFFMLFYLALVDSVAFIQRNYIKDMSAAPMSLANWQA